MLDVEQRKYDDLWTNYPQYRRYSPGEVAVTRFLELANPLPGDTVLDAGCGGGTAAVMLKAKSLGVSLVDFSDAAPDGTLRAFFPFHHCSLDQLPQHVQPHDWVFCVDVMEHIPEPMVLSSFEGMREVCKRGAYFEIGLTPDGCGKLIGETLHVTLKPPEWWLPRVLKFWPEAKAKIDNGNLMIFGGLR